MEMQMDWSYVGAVVITGLVIVFVALILLIAAVWIMGKIFGAIKPKNVSCNSVIQFLLFIGIHISAFFFYRITQLDLILSDIYRSHNIAALK